MVETISQVRFFLQPKSIRYVTVTHLRLNGRSPVATNAGVVIDLDTLEKLKKAEKSKNANKVSENKKN